jgi:hypothetical protein
MKFYNLKKNKVHFSIYKVNNSKKIEKKPKVKYCVVNNKCRFNNENDYVIKPHKIIKILNVKFLDINKFSEKLFSNKTL